VMFVTDCAKCNCKKKKYSICCLVGRFRFSHYLFLSDDKCRLLISHLYEMSLMMWPPSMYMCMCIVHNAFASVILVIQLCS